MKRMLARSGIWLVASALTLGTLLADAGVAQAQTDDRQRLYMRGAAAYGDGRFAEAATLFERAYALRPDAPLLYNLGLALERAGEVARAIDAYERFLAASPDAAERTEVERSLQTLRRQRVLEEEVARGRNAPPPDAPAPREPAAGSNPMPWIMAGVGGAALVAGVIVGAMAQAEYDRASNEPEHLRATELEQSANDLGTAATVLFIAGGAVAGAGLTWGIIVLAKGSGSEENASATVGIGLGSVSIRGTF